MKTIPLTRGLADYVFNVTLGNHQLRFNIRWLTRYQYFVVDITTLAGDVVVMGRALHAGVDLLAGLNTDIGRLVLTGATPTMVNLGVENNLTWYDS
ncbi:MAG: hypothetical protein ABN480_14245 [Dickeya sp.]